MQPGELHRAGEGIPGSVGRALRSGGEKHEERKSSGGVRRELLLHRTHSQLCASALRASTHRRGTMMNATPPSQRCPRIPRSIAPRSRASGTQFNTIEHTTTRNSPSGRMSKKSRCSMRGCEERRSTARTLSQGTLRS